MPFDVVGLLRSGRLPLYLAPQAGVSESPFRRLCKRFGADVVVSEFVSAEGIVRGNEKTLEYLRFSPDESPIGVQIFGAEPIRMAEAASFVCDVFGPDFIDINFGCPVKKVVTKNGGSGCLRDLNLVARVTRAVADAVPVPTTVKIRSGYDEASRDPVRIALVCQDAGARAVTLHPRTRVEMYSGQANWSEIAAVKRALEVPVIGNGDIRTAADVVRMHELTGCDGIMIARGSHGGPWLFTQARAALSGEPVPSGPGVRERFDICLDHAANAIAFGGDPERALLEFRKHLGWYMKGLEGGRALRQELFEARTLKEVRDLLEGYGARCRGFASRVEQGDLAPATV
jgi:nifR3 family TIM-barrel protein